MKISGSIFKNDFRAEPYLEGTREIYGSGVAMVSGTPIKVVSRRHGNHDNNDVELPYYTKTGKLTVFVIKSILPLSCHRTEAGQGWIVLEEYLENSGIEITPGKLPEEVLSGAPGLLFTFFQNKGKERK